jgi:hypothetical protein
MPGLLTEKWQCKQIVWVAVSRTQHDEISLWLAYSTYGNLAEKKRTKIMSVNYTETIFINYTTYCCIPFQPKCLLLVKVMMWLPLLTFMWTEVQDCGRICGIGSIHGTSFCGHSTDLLICFPWSTMCSGSGLHQCVVKCRDAQHNVTVYKETRGHI